ncbi:MAG: hypothetical protein LUQ31_08300 [Methanoregula sp.]|nr:hypothetical protein [Methanoregula sp.]
MIKGLVLFVVLVACVQVVSASFTMSTVTINPSGDLTPGTAVTVSYAINFASSGDETFSSSDSLQMQTDLEKPTWTWTLVLNDVENSRPQSTNKILTLSGWDISYPSSVSESVKVTLEGTAPSVTSTTNKTLIKIKELDSNSNEISGSTVSYTTLVVNTGEITTAASSASASLQTFRSEIDEKAALDVDTSAAEAKYNEAQQDISTAQSLPATQYSTAQSTLTAATQAITDGETALDKAWAQKEISDAQVPINYVDSLITFFQSNTSTANDARLSTIVTKREVAVSYLSAANDALTNGNYATARTHAEDAFNKANESYTDALTFQTALLTSGWNPLSILGSAGSALSSGAMIIVVIVIIIVLVIVGIIIYRKRSRWDELG